MTEWITREQMQTIPAMEQSSPQVLAKQPRVSVLMMTRNHAEYLREAVESVVRQVCAFPVELIIGEDHSDDGTLKLALSLQAEFPSLIRVIHAERNVGITANFLRLVAHSRGEYIAFLEGDDYWVCETKLQQQVDLMESHREYSWCGGKTLNRMNWLPVQASYRLDHVLRRYFVHTSTVLFRRSSLDRYPAFPDRVCWESMLLGYLSGLGDAGFIDETFSYYRRHTGGLWHNAARLPRIAMSRDCIDALNTFYERRHAKALADREVWIYRMDFAPPDGRFQIGYWFQSFAILRSAWSRVLPEAMWPYIGLWALLVSQPLTLGLLGMRRRVALGTRWRTLRQRSGN